MRAGGAARRGGASLRLEEELMRTLHLNNSTAFPVQQRLSSRTDSPKSGSHNRSSNLFYFYFYLFLFILFLLFQSGSHNHHNTLASRLEQ